MTSDCKKEEAIILTAETVPAYLKDRADEIGVIDKDQELTAEAILGGNINYAFRVEGASQTLFVKQAPEFVAIFGPDGLPLTSQRMQHEIDVFDEWKTILGPLSTKYLPTIYLFDTTNVVTVMEFFEEYNLLDHELVERSIFLPQEMIAVGLGEFLGKTHAATHSTRLSKERVEYLTERFENRPMRDLQLEYVFTKCYKEATDEQREGWHVTPEFLQEIEILKKEYDGGNKDNLVLSHGDFHPGSVMVNSQGSVKVIDPEFTVYGPPGLDAGSLLSGYVLAAVHLAYEDRPEAVEAIIQATKAIWNSYKRNLQEGGISDETVKRIEAETVGFTVAEVCRTALEFAGKRRWLEFDDPETKAASKKAALHIVNNCMLRRHEEGIDLLLTEMKALLSRVRKHG